MKYQDKVSLIKEYVQNQTPDMNQQEILSKAVIKPQVMKKKIRLPKGLSIALSSIFIFILLIILIPNGYNKELPQDSKAIDYQYAASVLISTLYEDVFIDERLYAQVSDETINFINYYLPSLEILHNLETVNKDGHFYTAVDGANVEHSYGIEATNEEIIVNTNNQTFSIIKNKQNNCTYLIIKKDDTSYIKLIIYNNNPNVYLVEIMSKDRFISKCTISLAMNEKKITIINQFDSNNKNAYEIFYINNLRIDMNIKSYYLDELQDDKNVIVLINNTLEQYLYTIESNQLICSR